jgi:group I intron endonuclease
MIQAERILHEESELFGFLVDPSNWPLPIPGAYGLFCAINDKWYIGISQNVYRRICEHSRIRKRCGPKLRRALEKYGPSSFRVIPLCYSLSGTDWLPDLEASLIRDFDAALNGYNIVVASGGVGPYGEEFSRIMKQALARPEVRERQSAAARIVGARPDIRAKRSAFFRKWLSDPEFKRARQDAIDAANQRPETKDRRKAAGSQLFDDPLLAAKHSKAVQSVARSAAGREQRARQMREYLATAEGRDRRISQLDGMRTPEMNARRGASLSAALADPTLKARRQASIDLANKRPEVKQRRSDSAKAAWARRRIEVARP